MFVMTMKFTRKKAVFIVLAAAVIIAAIVIIVGSQGSPRDPGGFTGNAGRLEYLSSLGWECEPEPVGETTVVIPAKFDSVMTKYNALQRQQGFDLQKYAGFEVTLYTYRVTNYPSDEEVVAQMFIFGGLLIGGDIHSTSASGFMHGLK